MQLMGLKLKDVVELASVVNHSDRVLLGRFILVMQLSKNTLYFIPKEKTLKSQ